MDLIPWKPFREIESLRREMDSLWNSFLDYRPSVMGRKGQEWQPATDIVENKDNILVRVELPGLEPEDIKVSLTDDRLAISGERKQEEETREENFYRLERHSGSFTRTYRLPALVRKDAIDAVFEKGVLVIKLPKLEEEKQKQIEIKVK